MPATEKVAVAGLGRMAARILGGVGILGATKGMWDVAVGVPESVYFSSAPWAIVSKAAWIRFALFEIVFGLSCVWVGRVVWLFSRRLPEWFERPVVTEISSSR